MINNSTYFRVQVFATDSLLGNTAIVIPIKEIPPANTLQAIAKEFNQPATVFVCSKSEEHFYVRWFSPTHEIKLCGHGAIATANVLWQTNESTLPKLNFSYPSGCINIYKNAESICVQLPRITTQNHLLAGQLETIIISALGALPIDISLTQDEEGYAVVRYDSEQAVKDLQPNFAELSKTTKRAIIVTARATTPSYDVVQRYFAPCYGLDEDAATGSAASVLAPYWHRVAGISHYWVRQLSVAGAYMKVSDGEGFVLVSGAADIVETGQLVHPS